MDVDLSILPALLAASVLFLLFRRVPAVARASRLPILAWLGVTTDLGIVVCLLTARRVRDLFSDVPPPEMSGG